MKLRSEKECKSLKIEKKMSKEQGRIRKRWE